MSDTAARSLIQQVEPELARLQRDANAAAWEASVGGTPEAFEAARLKWADLLRFLSDPTLYRQAELLRTGVQDPLVARQVDWLYRSALPNQLTAEEIEEVSRRETELADLFVNFRANLDGSRVSDNEIRGILREDKHNVIRQAAWEAQKSIGHEAAPKVLQLVRLRNAIARRLGFSNFYAMSLATAEQDEGELFALLDDLRRRTDEPFRQVKAELDAELAPTYGISPDQMQAWHYHDPFFQEVPASDAVNIDPLYAGKDLVAAATAFFEDAGLAVRPVLARSDLYEREGKDQHAFMIDIDRRGDVRVLCNLRPDEYWMGALLHELGHAVYEVGLDPSLPYLLAEPAHLLTTEAIAMLFGALSKDPGFLVQYAGAPATDVAAMAPQLRTQLRRSMLVFVRWGLVVTYFERELYRNPDQDLGALWWRLVGELQYVPTPPGRPAPDWAAKIHIATTPVYYHNYILGELLAAQLRATLLARGAEAPVIGNPQAGPFLREHVFAPGARWHWQELIRRATGEPLTSKYFVTEYVDTKG